MKEVEKMQETEHRKAKKNKAINCILGEIIDDTASIKQEQNDIKRSIQRTKQSSQNLKTRLHK